MESKSKINFHIITLFPDVIEAYTSASILGRARKLGQIRINTHNLRKWGIGKHKKVDDRPFGGGPGMVMQVEPIYKSVSYIKSLINKKTKNKTRVILFSTRGKLFTEKEAKRLSKYTDIVLICGRYEGVDERVARYIADEEISVGNFVLTGGEIPALTIIDSISRFIQGVIGKNESREDIKGSYKVYTRPEKFMRWNVPKELLSGDHKKIEKIRKG